MSAQERSQDRLQRMLALVPWILANPGATLAELATRFDIEETQLEQDLELLPMCGLPPYTADRLIDVWVGDDGAVSIRLAEYFERPLRLTPAEGVALLAAGRTLLAVPGSDPAGPLARALEKLERTLGATGGITVDVGGANHVELLRAAADDGRQLEIEYYTFARDEMTTRVVDPVRVFHAFGAWYLAAYCHRAESDRLFRVDRVRAVRETGVAVPPRPAAADDGGLVYRPSPDDMRVRMRLGRAGTWVAENLPIEARKELRGGQVEVVLAVSGAAFLERLALGLGPDAEVVAPDEARAMVGAAARRILSRYEAGP